MKFKKRPDLLDAVRAAHELLKQGVFLPFGVLLQQERR